MKKKVYPPLPNDVYQFQVVDVTESLKASYNDPEEVEPALKFVLRCIEEGPYYGSFQWVEPTVKLVGGNKPSKLYSFLQALGHEFSKEQCTKQDEVLTGEFINSLIGEQVRLTLSIVKKDGDMVGRNKIEGFLPVKNVLPDFDPDKVKRSEPLDVYQQQRVADGGSPNGEIAVPQENTQELPPF